MTKVEMKPGRFIGKVRGAAEQPALIFIGGVHGNEPSGVAALEQAVELLDELKPRGSVYALYGNKWALERKVRFDKEDLNRIWSRERIHQLTSNDWTPQNHDETEQLGLWNAIQEILDYHTGPIYFMDLHTTSSETKPFIVLNDSLLNRAFTEQYPLPIILGIEEYLDGPLLSYINELGYIAFGFEAGSHDDPTSIKVHFSFIICTLGFTGLVSQDSTHFREAYQYLKALGIGMDSFYEIFFRYKISDGEHFVMQPGFANFQSVEKGTTLATSNSLPIYANRNARVFMPLYQSQGSEGFFAIRPVNAFFLRLSALLRNWKVDALLPLLPGVSWHAQDKSALIVNRTVARFFAKQIFHLLGYRSRELDQNHYILRNREAASRTADYQNGL